MRRAHVLLCALALAACGRTLLEEAGEGANLPSGAGGTSAASVVASTALGVIASSGAGPGPGPGPSVSVVASSAMASSSTGVMTCDSLGDKCTTCISFNCPASWCGCVNDKLCLPLLKCWGGCNGDPNCAQACMKTYQDGISDALLISGCAGTTCNGACGWGTKDFNPCQECIFTDCQKETNACLAGPPCIELWQCLNACPPLQISCHKACYDKYPSGVATLEPLLSCTVKNCSKQCPGK